MAGIKLVILSKVSWRRYAGGITPDRRAHVMGFKNLIMSLSIHSSSTLFVFPAAARALSRARLCHTDREFGVLLAGPLNT